MKQLKNLKFYDQKKIIFWNPKKNEKGIGRKIKALSVTKTSQKYNF